MTSRKICEWPASLYDEKSRSWKYGTLGVLHSDIVFTPDANQGNFAPVSIPYVDVVDIKLSTTGLVFGAIYVMTKNNKKVWFSSLPDRSGIHGALNHFWKAQLFLQDEKESKAAGRSKTQMGQKLLGIVQDSEETLSKASEQLYHQGRQLDKALRTMDKLHNDLDVAENFVEELESWFGRWRLPEQYQAIDPVFVNKSEIPEVFEYEIIFNKIQTNRSNHRQVGNIRISKDGITIVNMKMKNEYHFKWSNVSEIRVLTPWEIMIIRHQIGQADIKYSVVSANMAAVLRLLDKCAKYKLKYDTPPERVLCTNHLQEPTARGFTSQNAASGSSTSDQGSFKHSFPSCQGVDQLQINQSEEIVSQSEANELSRRLEDLKSLAIGVQLEGCDQMETIDSLTTAVDNANIRLEDNQRRIVKLT
ncbi:Synaptosomal-associated protein 47 [Mactra antiquata]